MEANPEPIGGEMKTLQPQLRTGMSKWQQQQKKDARCRRIVAVLFAAMLSLGFASIFLLYFDL